MYCKAEVAVQYQMRVTNKIIGMGKGSIAETAYLFGTCITGSIIHSQCDFISNWGLDI